MAFRRQMHDSIRLMFFKNAVKRSAVADIYLLKSIAFAVRHGRHGFWIAGVGKLIKINHPVLGVVNNMSYNSGANKSGAAGH